MKTYKSLLLQIIFLLLLSHLSFSQEVEVNLGGNTTSDAFVVRDSSGNLLLKMDGDQNFGINSEQPDGIEIKGRSGLTNQENGDPINIIGGSSFNGVGGSVSILGGSSEDYGGSVIIRSGNSPNGGNGNVEISNGEDGEGGDGGDILIYTQSMPWYAGNIAIKTGDSNMSGGSITIATGYANAGGNNIILKTGETASGPGGSYIEISENGIELNGSGEIDGIILNPRGHLVEIIGSGTYTGTWTQASDKRYKSNTKPISGILNKVEMLKPVEYEWNKEEYPDNNFPDGNQIGLIAQEVEELFPEMVATNQDGYKSIDYSKISVLLIQAMKEQQNEINRMKSDIEELKSMILQDSDKFSSNDNLYMED